MSFGSHAALMSLEACSSLFVLVFGASSLLFEACLCASFDIY